MNCSRYGVLGVGISATTMHAALAQISNWIEAKKSAYVSVCTVHTVMECQNNPTMLRIVNNAGLAVPDGMPLVWLGKLLSSDPVSRVYGPDLMLELCRLSIKGGYSHYFYGGSQGVPEKLSKTLSERYPGLKIVGTHSPPFRTLTKTEDRQMVEQIIKASPDILWIGLGTPKQDIWIDSHIDYLNPSVIIGVGAAFDFHTGRVPQANHWIQKMGLEWLFRFIHEPKRLWRRYLVYNPLFILKILAQLLGIRRYTIS